MRSHRIACNGRQEEALTCWGRVCWRDRVGAANPWVTVAFALASLPNAGFARYNSSSAQNDAIAYKFPLSAGTYTIGITVRESTNTGIATVEVDGSSVGTLDTYNATSGTPGQLSLTGVTIGSSGVHEIRLVAATKNSSSTGYQLVLIGLGVTRTA